MDTQQLTSEEHLAWGILAHMLGWDKTCVASLDKVDDVSLLPVAKALGDYLIHTGSPRNRRRELLPFLVERLGPVLDSDMKAMRGWGYECGRSPVRVSNESVEHPEFGLSRDAFKPLGDSIANKVALLAACYLLRGHSLFFCRSRLGRDFNAAKVSLNDFHQSFQLAWRLYHRLPTSHHHRHKHMRNYWRNITLGPKFTSRPADSEFFVWNLFMLCEIMRGNVYRRLDYIDEADRYYRHAQDRFSQLIGKSQQGPLHEGAVPGLRDFVTPSLIRSVFERSKVQFDLGQFLGALLNQVRCLYYLVLLGRSEQDRDNGLDHGLSGASDPRQTTKLLDYLWSIQEFLDAERHLPMFDRERVCYLFGCTWAKPLEWDEAEPASLATHALASCIDDRFGDLTADILSRMGFILYTIRPRMLSRSVWSGDQQLAHDAEVQCRQDWLGKYFAFFDQWNQTHPNFKIQQPDYAQYGQTLLQQEASVSGVFFEQLDRRFALQLRQAIAAQQLQGRALPERDFYLALLSATTQNIGNLVTIPRRNRSILMRRGYLHRRSTGDLSKLTVAEGLKTSTIASHVEPPNPEKIPGKLVVLRRYQSYNPIIPRPRRREVRGGGYFLLWRGRGIVIDPGFDFIQNFYDEGFSLDDISAIVITHSHPDHDNDFASLTTLVTEWNDFQRKSGQDTRVKLLDVFLNESTHSKFSAWLQAAKVELGRVIPLPSLWWYKDGRYTNRPIRGRNVRIDLRRPDSVSSKLLQTYGMEIEIVPAWHDDVIGKTAAVGLKFHLYDRDESDDGDASAPACVVGYTSDTGAYGVRMGEPIDDEECCPPITSQFKDCQVLIAHLGDVRFRELASVLNRQGFTWPGSTAPNPVLSLLRDSFASVRNLPDDERHVEARNRVHDFLQFLITLDLVPSEALEAQFRCTKAKKEPLSVQEWLGAYVSASAKEGRESLVADDGVNVVLTLVDQVSTKTTGSNSVLHQIRVELDNTRKIARGFHLDDASTIAYEIMEYLALTSMLPWHYKYHLGVAGVYRLFEAMAKYWGETSELQRKAIFIVDELPEELASYRHAVAHYLNMTEVNVRGGTPSALAERVVHAFTGDIGLHVRLARDNGVVQPTIRCMYCNYNNEVVYKGKHYHSPEKILETPIKRLGGQMIYLCTEKDHHPEDLMRPRHFLNRPELRVV